MEYIVNYFGKKYAFDFNKLVEICQPQRKADDGEKEITEAYQLNDDDEFELVSKINHEVTTKDSNDLNGIVYDAIKMFISRVINDVYSVSDKSDENGLKFCINTLLHAGLIIELEN